MQAEDIYLQLRVEFVADYFAASTASAVPSRKISNVARLSAVAASWQKVRLKIAGFGDFFAASGAVSERSLQIQDFRWKFKSSARVLKVQRKFAAVTRSSEFSAEK